YSYFLPGTTSPLFSAFRPMATGDFNGDHQGDVLLVDSLQRKLTVAYLNDTHSTSIPSAISGPSPGGVPLVADLDGDGVSDIVWTSSISGTYRSETWFMSPTSLTPKSTTIATSTTDKVVALGNFDGDS